MAGSTGADDGADGAALRALMQCLVVMAGADKRLTLSEIEVVSQLYAEEAGREADQALVAEVFAQLKDCQPAEAMADLRRAEPGIAPDMKERIVAACAKVMSADRAVDAKERERLAEIASCLGLSQDRIDRLTREARG